VKLYHLLSEKISERFSLHNILSMKNYYFLATLLPQLRVGSPPEMSSRELDFLLRQNLNSDDFQQVSILRQLVDLDNMRALWVKEPVKAGGNFDEQELEENLLFRQHLPSYVIKFLDTYPETEKRIRHFPVLLRCYFEENTKSLATFLGKYLQFEWQWRVVFCVLRSRRLGRDFLEELQIENQEEPFISEIISLNQGNFFQPPAPYEGLLALYEAKREEPLELYQAISEWRFSYIESMIEWDNFSFERILGFVAQLEICEEWLQLDKRKGSEIVKKLMEVTK
jgi:hypothetical protein